MKAKTHPLLSRLLAVVSIVLLAQAKADASYLIILDMDVSTTPGPPPPGPLPGAPGPATGFESTIGVISGSTVTVIAYIVSTTGGFSLDSIGLNVNFGAIGDTALVTGVGPNPAGFLAAAGSGGAPPFSADVTTGTLVGPGSPLVSAGLPPIVGFTGSHGGSGFYDLASPAPAPAGQFSGLGFMPGPGTYVDVMGIDFVVSGAPGSSVTLMPSGIFAPGPFPAGSPPMGIPKVPGGNAVYDSVTGFTTAGSYAGGTITIIPEPSALVLLGVGFFSILRRRKM